jgi:hypothetical protein
MDEIYCTWILAALGLGMLEEMKRRHYGMIYKQNYTGAG